MYQKLIISQGTSNQQDAKTVASFVERRFLKPNWQILNNIIIFEEIIKLIMDSSLEEVRQFAQSYPKPFANL